MASQLHHGGVSETGCKLTVSGSIEGLNLKEFFLVLSSTGLAYRRCEQAWVTGDQIGVRFVQDLPMPRSATPSAAPIPSKCDPFRPIHCCRTAVMLPVR